MGYTPQEWEDFPEGGTPIDADSLNYMEAGIAAAMDQSDGDTRYVQPGQPITNAPYVKVSGLSGVALPSRYLGAVNGAPPASGTWLKGDWVVDILNGGTWTCIAAGTPGSWTNQFHLSDEDPQVLGRTSYAGALTGASREDHVHVLSNAWTGSSGGLMTATVTNPTNYTSAIRSFRSGKTLFFVAEFRLGAGFTVGSGTYIFNLNLPNLQAQGNNQVVTCAYDYNGGSGGSRYAATGLVTNDLGVQITRVVTSGTTQGVNSATHSWVSGGWFRFNGVIETI